MHDLICCLTSGLGISRTRRYVLRDDIRHGTREHHLVLPHGALLLLGPKTNQEYYHSIPLMTEVGHRRHGDWR
jgi:alkylated DNA repair dioxygenase AlkB